MRVALIAGVNPSLPRAGGIRSHVVGLGEALARMGHDVIIIGAGPFPSIWSQSVRFVPVTENAAPSSFQFLAALFRRAGAMPVGEAVIHFQRPDDMVPFLLRTDPLAKVVTVHGSPQPGIRERHGPTVAALYRILETVGLRSADRIVVLDQQTQDHLLAKYPGVGERISIATGGVDLNRFKPIPRSDARRALGLADRPTIAYVGRFALEKNVGLLLKVFGKVNDAQLVVAGQGTLQAELKSLAHGSPRVRFLGVVDYDRIPIILNAADVLALPSHREAMPAVCLESLACGTPVVAAPVGALPNLIHNGRNGFLVEPEETAFGAKLALALERSEEMRESCRASVLPFGWGEVAARMIRIYEEAVRHHSNQNPSRANV